MPVCELQQRLGLSPMLVFRLDRDAVDREMIPFVLCDEHANRLAANVHEPNLTPLNPRSIIFFGKLRHDADFGEVGGCVGFRADPLNDFSI